jgi:preprotein translocase subunit SecD
MWLLHFLPDSFILWIVNIVFIIGLVGTIAGFFIKFIPFINTYKLPVQVVSTILLCLGIYLKGGYSVEMQWRERVSDLEKQIQVAEAKSDQANKDLVTEREKKTKVIKEVQVVIQERIKEVSKKIDAECKVAPEAISILNDAALNVKGAGK